LHIATFQTRDQLGLLIAALQTYSSDQITC